MLSSLRQASLQLRVCIAMCIFVLVASIPLHLVDLEPGKYLIFKLPKIEKGGGKYALYYQFDTKKQQAMLRYQNRFRIPVDLIDQCLVQFRDRDGTIKHIRPQEISWQVGGPSDSILTITIDVKPLIKRLQLVAEKERKKKQQQGADDRQAAAEAGQVLSEREQQQQLRRLLHYHHLILDIFQKPNVHRARITGQLMSSRSYVDDVEMTYPFQFTP